MPRIAHDHIVSQAKLVVDYALQPIIEINTGYVYGYEALLRGYDRLNLTSPIDLLDAADQAGALVTFEQMLHTRAIAKFARLRTPRAKCCSSISMGAPYAAGIECWTPRPRP